MLGGDDEDSSLEGFSDCIATIRDNICFDNIVSQLNEEFDATKDYLGSEITSITSHRFTSGVFEFHTEYCDCDTEWHQINLVIDTQL